MRFDKLAMCALITSGVSSGRRSYTKRIIGMRDLDNEGVEMPIVRLLVSSRESLVGDLLKSHLPSSQFEIHMAKPGVECLDRALLVHPDIVVIETDRDVPGSDIEIAAVNHACPDARIVALGPAPPMSDGVLVERGTFYYLLGPWRDKLVEVVEAAAQSLRPARAHR